jgi:hypothetical protein
MHRVVIDALNIEVPLSISFFSSLLIFGRCSTTLTTSPFPSHSINFTAFSLEPVGAASSASVRVNCETGTKSDS